jgi:hypothetical protein
MSQGNNNVILGRFSHWSIIFRLPEATIEML